MEEENSSIPAVVAAVIHPPTVQEPVQESSADNSAKSFLDTGMDTPSLAAAYVVIDQAKKQALMAKFEETINNPRFWAKESRYKTLMDNLVIPVFDDRSLQQFFNHATDDLITAAAKKSSSSGLPVVMPTEEEIKAEVWRRCEAGLMEQEIKVLNQRRKAEAKIAGTKHVQVKAEEVKVSVDLELANMRAAENC